MGHYITVAITGEDAGRVKIHNLPDFGLFESQAWQWDGGRVYMSGSDKYEPEHVWVWARKYSRKHPGLTITYRTEWDTRDADEPGSEEKVYRAGELVEADSKVSGELPMNLDELLLDARRAITAYHMPMGEEQVVIEGLVNALERLVKGLS